MSQFKTSFGAVAASAAVVAALIAAPATASAENRQVTVINRTGHTITNLYAAGRVYNRYTDWLGREVIEPGYQMRINFDDGDDDCEMVVVARFSDGTTASSDDFDVCSRSEMVFTGN